MTDIAGIRTFIARFVQPDRRGALLPLLHALQEEFAHIPSQAVPAIAETLNLSRAEVHGVISFYPDFRTEPRHLGVAMGHARKDGQVALEPVYCLGLCAIGPNALVDGRPVARIDEAQVEAIAREVEA